MERKKLRLIVTNKTTIAMLITLLATNKVANNFLGRSNKCEIILVFRGFFDADSSKSSAESEKNATSAPEINAAKNNNTIIRANPIITVRSSVSINCKLGGSGSKSVKIG